MMADSSIFQQIPSILIVDDTPANLELLAGMLSARGYEPRPVVSGKLALAAARADPPDLILLDILMPDMDGYEVCAHLKADEALQEIPVIFISALTATTDIIRAFKLGAVDYLSKPFQIAEVDARVRTHLKIRHLQRQLLAQNENLERLVAERTRELALANERMQQLSQLKDDFLRMISYEIRTPANGVLGMGNLLIDLCPESEEREQYRKAFEASSLRLRHLIDDATLLANNDELPQVNRVAVSFSALVARQRKIWPEIKILIDHEPLLEVVSVSGDKRLLERAFESVILLGSSFSRNKSQVRIFGTPQAGKLCLRLDLDAFALSEQAAADFFDIESKWRISSPAEPLGLAPTVAHRIIAAFGGELRLVKTDATKAYLEVVLITEPKQL